MDTVLNTIINGLEYQWIDEVVRLLNACQIHQSQAERVPGNKYLTPGLPGTMFVAQQVCPISFLGNRWVWDADMAEVLVADETGLGKV